MSRRDYGSICAAKDGVYAIARNRAHNRGGRRARERVGADKKACLIKRIRGQARPHRRLRSALERVPNQA